MHYLIITHAGLRKSIAIIMVSNHLQNFSQALLLIAILSSNVFSFTGGSFKARKDD